MPELPADLHTQCRTILLQCREFESDRTLRVLFGIGDLWPFRIGLPEASSLPERVDLCLDYVLKQRLSDGRPVLPVLLATLRDRYLPGDALRDDLEILYQNVQSVMSQPKTQQALHPHHKQELFKSLLKIDFLEHVRLVKQTLELHRVAAFLVHGEPNFGQQVLVNRLLQLTPRCGAGRRISINLASNGTGKDIHFLWREVARNLNASPRTPSIQLAEKVCEWWQTQDVIFIFHTVDYMLPDYLSQWIEDFWQPLVKAAHSNLHRTQRETRLVMFLVDYSGCVCNWNITLAQQPEEPQYPRVPLRLPPADRFPSELLDSWIGMVAEMLPADLTAQVILEASENGIPQIVYQAICDHCGLSWEGELMKWLV